MAWSSGTYTKGNAATGGWAGDAAGGIGIEAGRHDTQDNDFQNGINNCLTKDGQNTPTANLPMGGLKHTGVGNATADNQYAAWGQLRNGAPVYLDTVNNRVGIGTSAPGSTLDIQSTTLDVQASSFSANAFSGALTLRKSRGATVGINTIVQSQDEVGVLRFQGANGTGYSNLAAIVAFVDGTPGATNDMPGRLAFYTTPDGTGSWVERMRISSSGKIGIGTTSPFALMDVAGSLQIGSSATASNNFHITAETTGALQFWNGNYGAGSERMRILSNGNVGIGVAAPTALLQLGTDSAAKPTTNTWTIVSDERIKTNIQPYAKGLAEIQQVQPITYDYNGKGGIPAGPGGVSIIAQAIQAVFPECVGTFSAKLNEEDEEETELLNYNGHAITFALINAVKELSAKVEALEAQLEANTIV